MVRKKSPGGREKAQIGTQTWLLYWSRETYRGEVLDEYLYYGTQDLSNNTLKSYTVEINNHIKPFLGKIPLVDLTPFHLVEYYQYKLEEGKLSTSTINYHHRILKAAFGQPIPVRL